MSQRDDALRTSAALDDGAGGLDASFAGQGRVHAALSARGAAPVERPSLDVHARVMMRIGAGSAARGSWGWGPSTPGLWPLAMAASLTALAATGWVLTHRTPVLPAGPSVARAQSTPFAALLRPLANSDAAVQASEGPFLREARLIREDSRQGMEIVLSRLPMGSGGFR
jgi:hypothetical protein